MKAATGLKSVGGLWVAQVLKLTLSILVSILVIRYLGPEQYGVLGVAAACVILFSALVGLPQGGLIVRELAKAGDDGARRVLSTAIVLKLGGALLQVVLVVAAVTMMGYSHDIRWSATFIAIAYVAGCPGMLTSALEFDGRFDRIAMAELGSSIATSLGRLALVWIGAPLLWFAAAGIFDALVVAGAYTLASDRRSQLHPLRDFSPELGWQYFRDGWPIVITALAMSVYLRTDILVVSHVFGEREAGLYSAAVRITEVLYYFPGVIASIYFPTLARRKQDDTDGYYRLITNSCGAAFWLGIALALGLTLTAPLLLPILLGPKFLATIGVVEISAWSIAMVALSTAFNGSLTIEHATRVPLYATLVGAVVNILLLLVLVPWLGINGAALATLTAQTVSLITSIMLYRDVRLIAAVLAALSPAFVLTSARYAWQLVLSHRH